MKRMNDRARGAARPREAHASLGHANAHTNTRSVTRGTVHDTPYEVSPDLEVYIRGETERRRHLSTLGSRPGPMPQITSRLFLTDHLASAIIFPHVLQKWKLSICQILPRFTMQQ
ncbi:hypothetical protein DPEC_G00235820 [Dallia pectoralis]|uniref:Uncharacterized protein n=1 Tax=Dallia pectoralis TaxID=75939 RepID=A0ACC2FYL3_DALPE|nr:hypothetical protein DPEC_G00235820 [Dallia pectoralis]